MLFKLQQKELKLFQFFFYIKIQLLLKTNTSVFETMIVPFWNESEEGTTLTQPNNDSSWSYAAWKTNLGNQKKTKHISFVLSLTLWV